MTIKKKGRKNEVSRMPQKANKHGITFSKVGLKNLLDTAKEKSCKKMFNVEESFKEVAKIHDESNKENNEEKLFKEVVRIHDDSDK